MKNTYSIGEFSQVTGLSVKTLRFYHEKGLLVPSSIDEVTGYRFYDAGKIDKARIIMQLRAMEFSLEDIAGVLADNTDESDILNHLERQRLHLQRRIRDDRDIVRSLDQIISTERAARQLLENNDHAVMEKVLEPVRVAGLKMKGRYEECGPVFARIGKAVGRHISGKPLCLYYDGEFREDDAEFEPCFPVRKEISAPGFTVHTLAGGPCLTVIHRGPYDQLGRSYARVLQEARARHRTIRLPTREVYLKGPGMIFKGNPKNYLTEIQLPLEMDESSAATGQLG